MTTTRPPASISSTARRRSCARSSRSTPTSRRPRSISARSTSRAFRCSFPSGATSSSTAPPFFDFGSDTQRRGQGGFYFGGNATSDDQVIPFFSRRIGLSADATPQKIDFGTKVTGQVGAQDVGFLHVRTGEDNGFASEDFTVARVKRRICAQSYMARCTPGAIRAR